MAELLDLEEGPGQREADQAEDIGMGEELQEGRGGGAGTGEVREEQEVLRDKELADLRDSIVLSLTQQRPLLAAIFREQDRKNTGCLGKLQLASLLADRRLGLGLGMESQAADMVAADMLASFGQDKTVLDYHELMQFISKEASRVAELSASALSLGGSMSTLMSPPPRRAPFGLPSDSLPAIAHPPEAVGAPSPSESEVSATEVLIDSIREKFTRSALDASFGSSANSSTYQEPELVSLETRLRHACRKLHPDTVALDDEPSCRIEDLGRLFRELGMELTEAELGHVVESCLASAVYSSGVGREGTARRVLGSDGVGVLIPISALVTFIWLHR